MDFFKYKNRLKPLRGRLLISEPFLADPNFERTIILLCDHNEEGTFGFVVNKPSLAKIGDVMEAIKTIDATVFVGGPVQQDTLHYLHRMADLEGAVEIGNGIFWGGNFEQMNLLLDSGQLNVHDVKFFLGYSGWSPGQLEEEIKANSWIISDQLSGELIFETDPDVMWKAVLKSMGGRFSVFSNYPVDPRMN